MIHAIQLSDVDLVGFRGKRPFCKKHGEMNCFKIIPNLGKTVYVWRCITTYKNPNLCSAECKITKVKD